MNSGYPHETARNLILYGCAAESDTQTINTISNVPAENEIVMTEGMQITATTPGGMIKANIGGKLKDLHPWEGGTITITAEKGIERSYTWEEETRSVIMRPRKARWLGSMGIYYPGPGNHWKEHNGISRGVVQEGQQHFTTKEDALIWLKSPSRHNCTYRNDGLVVCFSKTPERRQINVDVWQIYIGGKTVSKFQETIQDKDGYYAQWDKRINQVYYVGGQKPKSLAGSQDNSITIRLHKDNIRPL